MQIYLLNPGYAESQTYSWLEIAYSGSAFATNEEAMASLRSSLDDFGKLQKNPCCIKNSRHRYCPKCGNSTSYEPETSHTFWELFTGSSDHLASIGLIEHLENYNWYLDSYKINDDYDQKESLPAIAILNVLSFMSGGRLA